MIIPDDELLPDDSQPEDFEQSSQQDIHSNGFDENTDEPTGEIDETDKLNQAYNASESAYTLNLDDEPASDE